MWPWLLGPFFEGYLKVNHYDGSARQQIDSWLRSFESHLNTAGLGQVSKIFDADAPHAPAGCTAQAWSVAEVLRVQALNALFNEKRMAASATSQNVATTAS